MSREILEDGPRLEVRFSEDELEGLLEGLTDGGYQRVGRGPDPDAREIRRRHPGGTIVRLFPRPGLLYVYPPGGTRRPTGPIAPFSPLKAACNAANERLPAAEGGDAADENGPDEAADAAEESAAGGSSAGAGPSDPTSSPGSGNGDDE